METFRSNPTSPPEWEVVGVLRNVVDTAARRALADASWPVWLASSWEEVAALPQGRRCAAVVPADPAGLARLRQEHPELCLVVVVPAPVAENEVQRLVEQGLVVLEAPVRPWELVQTLRLAAGRGGPQTQPHTYRRRLAQTGAPGAPRLARFLQERGSHTTPANERQAAIRDLAQTGLKRRSTDAGGPAPQPTEVSAATEAQASEQRYRALVEGAAQGILVFRGQQRLYFNDAFARIHGYGTASALAVPGDWRTLVAPEDHARLFQAVRSLERGEAEPPLSTAFRAMQPDGRAVWVEATLTRVDWDGAPALMATLQDISARKEAERKARQAHDRLREAINAMPALLYIYDEQERLVAWNNRVASYFPGLGAAVRHGMPYEEVLRLAAPDIAAAAEDTEAWLHQRLAVFRNPANEFAELQLKDGRWLQLLERRLAGGGTVALRQDITALKQSEASLMQQRTMLRTILDALPMSLHVKDTDGRYVEANETFARVLGLPREQVIGLDYHEALRRMAVTDSVVPDADEEVLASGQPIRRREIRAKQADGGERVLLMHKVPMRDAAGAITGIVSLYDNVTRERQLEAQLRHAQKMESVGQLAAGVAHDFNNLLQIISGYTQLAAVDLPPGDKSFTYLQAITDAANQARDITSHLLAYGRKQTMLPQPLQLNVLMESVATMVEHLVEPHVHIELEAGSNLPQVRGDPTLLQQVLVNLCLNARDAMPEGGTLILTTTERELDARDAAGTIHATAGRYACLTVRDSGTGIAPEHLEHIFDPFFTTKEVGQGSGLGLAMAFGIVRQHGGWINVESTPGVGTAMHVLLPAVAPEDTVETLDNGSDCGTPHPKRGPGHRATILVAEDAGPVGGVLQEVLTAEGFEVLATGGGTDAVACFARHAHEIDLVLLDYAMPDMNGEEAGQRIRAMAPTTPVLLLSAYNESWDGLEDAPVFEVLRKPIRPDDLTTIIRARLRR